MKLRKLIAAGLAAAVMAGYGAVASFAASLPSIHIRPNGMENEYVVTLQNVESKAYGVQFDLTLDSDQEITVQWADQDENTVQEAKQNVQNGKTTITFYVSKLRPLSTSTNVEIATLTTQSEMKEESFQTSGTVKTVDEKQRATVYENVRLDVKLSPEIPDQPGDSGSSGSWADDDDSSSSSKNDTVSWSDVSSKVKTKDGQKTLSLNMKAGQRLDSKIMKQVLEDKIILTVKYGNFTWTFDGTSGGTVPAKQKYYDFTVRTMNQRNLSIAAENSDILQFAINYSGVMPCDAVLTMMVGQEYQGQTVYLAFYDEIAGTLKKQTSAQVKEDGTVSFAMEHASKYVVTTKDLWATSSTTPSGTTNNNGQTSSNNTQPPVQTPSDEEPVVIVPPLETEEELAEEEQEETEPEEPQDEETATPEAPKQENKNNTAAIIAAVVCVVIVGGVVGITLMKKRSSK